MTIGSKPEDDGWVDHEDDDDGGEDDDKCHPGLDHTGDLGYKILPI
jgi:hypothetical protein